MTSDVTDGTAVDGARRRMLELITSGSLEPGQRLGSERELASDLGVSRTTLRQALGALEQSGVVRRVPGRGGGTFVSRAKIERDLSSVVGVPALLRAQGFTAGSRVISASILSADEVTAAALNLDAGGLVTEIVRIRLADGSPVSLEHARLPAERFPGLLELPLGGSVYELLDEHYGVRPVEALERIEAVSAGPTEASVLGVDAGAPLLSITRTANDGDGVPFEFSHDLFRADRTRILVRTPGAAGAAAEFP
ncbi:GntR family transcriptional regulator [Cryptosporangium arvum]|uniref:Transcriptional regulator n=1 Tax=Cryptosporangium arvum DSM 44712 TaxID=927661 RepID=A0A010YIV4_9ACTN|nr:GntR family transcriptional regulator [Cryptosporangium arvum]EXG80170.1 transcriptional regulator [Cryptosporangium arvum DSM 44712]